MNRPNRRHRHGPVRARDKYGLVRFLKGKSSSLQVFCRSPDETFIRQRDQTGLVKRVQELPEFQTIIRCHESGTAP